MHQGRRGVQPVRGEGAQLAGVSTGQPIRGDKWKRVQPGPKRPSFLRSFEQAINTVLEEEYANGAELVDIKLAATSPPAGTMTGTGFGEHVALILLRPGRAS